MDISPATQLDSPTLLLRGEVLVFLVRFSSERYKGDLLFFRRLGDRTATPLDGVNHSISHRSFMSVSDGDGLLFFQFQVGSDGEWFDAVRYWHRLTGKVHSLIERKDLKLPTGWTDAALISPLSFDEPAQEITAYALLRDAALVGERLVTSAIVSVSVRDKTVRVRELVSDLNVGDSITHIT